MNRAVPYALIAASVLSLIACFGGDGDDPEPEVDMGEVDMPEEVTLIATSVGYESFPGIGADRIAVGSLLPLTVSGSPASAAAPTEVSAASSDEAIVEVVRVTEQLEYASSASPERQIPIIEVRGKAIGEAIITINAKHTGVPVSTTFKVRVGQPTDSRIEPWCIERDSGLALDGRGALPGELIWFSVDSTAPGENINNPDLFRGFRADAVVVEPASAATLVPNTAYLNKYGLRVEAAADAAFTVQSAPNPANSAAEYVVVKEEQIEAAALIGYDPFGFKAGQTTFMSWSSTTAERFLCGQQEQASVTTADPAICTAKLIEGELAVRDAMCRPTEGARDACGYWTSWHPQKAIQVEGKAAGDCVVQLTLPGANMGAGVTASLSVPVQ
jgi:hypothetical protein